MFMLQYNYYIGTIEQFRSHHTESIATEPTDQLTCLSYDLLFIVSFIAFITQIINIIII